jgi:mannose-6-phosphate isomerase
MMQIPLYPLRFDPIYQYRLWGGRRLANLISAPLPETGHIGEAWVLSDRNDHSSRVANGPLKGWTIGELMEAYQRPLIGKWASCFNRSLFDRNCKATELEAHEEANCVRSGWNPGAEQVISG